MTQGSCVAGASVQSGSWQGLQVWDVQARGARARISAFGGQLLQWEPQADEPVLWLSPQLQGLPVPLRGGVPLCWPWFGRQGQAADAPSHGLARTAVWVLQHWQVLDGGQVELRLAPEQPLHPVLHVHQVLRIGQTLEQELHTHHRGNKALALSQALHSYFQVSHVAGVAVHGLEGVGFDDALHPERTQAQQGAWQWSLATDGGRYDRVYQHADGELVLVRGGGRRPVRIQTKGASSLVLWTPGPGLAAQMPDVGDAWEHYLCLEAGNVGQGAVVLQPGQSHLLGQRLALA